MFVRLSENVIKPTGSSNFMFWEVTLSEYSAYLYICPELSAIRDRNRFLYTLQADNGKPRTGTSILFNCFKNVKKQAKILTRRRVYIL